MGLLGLFLPRHLMLIDKLSGCTCAAFAFEGGGGNATCILYGGCDSEDFPIGYLVVLMTFS